MSQQGFAEFFARTWSRVLSAVIMATGCRIDAEDAVQEAYIQAHRHWDEISGYDAPEAWVIRVAIRRLLKGRRRQQREVDLWLEVAVPRTATPEETAEAHAVLSALATLPPDKRRAMVLCSVLGWKEEQIASEAGVPRSTIAGRIFSGRAMLRAKLGMPVPVHSSREPLLPSPRPLASPAVPDQDPLSAALVRTERWLRAGLEAEPDTASWIWAQITAPEPDPQDGQRQRWWRQPLRALPARARRAMPHAARPGKTRTAGDAKRSPR
jgi:RNA polymerase sigma factor (sigma-70 family)